jgi:hypothetical protein
MRELRYATVRFIETGTSDAVVNGKFKPINDIERLDYKKSAIKNKLL